MSDVRTFSKCSLYKRDKCVKIIALLFIRIKMIKCHLNDLKPRKNQRGKIG